MKKSVTLSLAIIGALLAGYAAQAAPTSAISPSTEVAVYSTNNNFYSSKAYPLAKDKTLVVWYERIEDAFSLKSKVVSATNSVGKVVVISPASTATAKVSLNTPPQIATNAKGEFFVAWISEEVIKGVISHKILGKTSKDGITWSSSFVIVKPQVVTGGQACLENSFAPNCGFIDLVVAMDNNGRFGVLTSSTKADGSLDYKVAATKTTKTWPALKLLGSVADSRRAEIVGLLEGFAVSYTNYSSVGFNTVEVSYFDPKTSTWTTTLAGQRIAFNSPVRGYWVQRDAKTLSLVSTSETQDGGVTVRNFDLTKKTWTGFEVQAQSSIPGIVFQDTVVLASAGNLYIGVREYNQETFETKMRLIVQIGSVGVFTHRFLDQENPFTLFLGVNSAKYPVHVFLTMEGGTQLQVLTGGKYSAPIINSADNGFLSHISVTKSNMVYGTGTQYDQDTGTTYLFLIKGKLK